MQLSWLLRGIRTGILTTRYPRRPETLPEGTRAMPVIDVARCRAAQGCDACAAACLPGAISLTEVRNGQTRLRFNLDYGKCIMCGLCVEACPNQAMLMTSEYELATRRQEDLVFHVDLNFTGYHGEYANGAGCDSANSNTA